MNQRGVAGRFVNKATCTEEPNRKNVALPLPQSQAKNQYRLKNLVAGQAFSGRLPVKAFAAVLEWAALSSDYP